MELLKAEFGKSWRRPILELAVVLVAVIAVGAAENKVFIRKLDNPNVDLFEEMANTAVVSFSWLELLTGVICSILTALSFARDYDQGLIQTLPSLHISRERLFLTKLIAIVVPLTVISWGYTAFSLGLNYYFAPAGLLKIILLELFMSYVTLVLYFGIASTVFLTIRRRVPSAIASSIIVIVLFILSFKEYVWYSPYQAPMTFLAKIFNITYLNVPLDPNQPAWIFMSLMISYAIASTLVPYMFFTRYLEVRE